MSILSSLKLVELAPITPKLVLNRRRKLIAMIDAQLELAERPKGNGGKGHVDKTGLKDRPKRQKRWWHETLDGKAILTVRYRSKPLELAQGKAAIECDDMAMLISTLKLLKQAVANGELDDLLQPKGRTGD